MLKVCVGVGVEVGGGEGEITAAGPALPTSMCSPEEYNQAKHVYKAAVSIQKAVLIYTNGA